MALFLIKKSLRSSDRGQGIRCVLPDGLENEDVGDQGLMVQGSWLHHLPARDAGRLRRLSEL